LNNELAEIINKAFVRSKCTKGYRSMTAHVNFILTEQSRKKVGEKRVLRIMRRLGLKCITRIPGPVYLKCPSGKIEDNLLNRKFSPQSTNISWATDFTYLKFNHGKNHIWMSAVIDLYSREIIGWKLCEVPTANEAIDTFKIAFSKFPNVNPLIHTDRGSTYTAIDFNNFLTENECVQSMSRPGTPYDNSIMESWWNVFKTDWFYTEANELNNLEDVIKLIEDGIKYFNTERRTQRKNGFTPEELREKSA
jgi:Transposase and inactivated derivatives